MTNQEARGILANLEADYRDLDPLVLTSDSIPLVNKRIEALGMAISALQAQDSPKPTAESVQNVQNEDLISRKAAIDAIRASTLKYTGFMEMEMYTDDDAVEAIEELPSAQPEIIRCKDCKHKPYPSDNYDYDNGDNGFEIIFPDYRCPCRCDDDYYNRIPDDDCFCGNAERRTDD